jgi:hypothetical protein
MNFREGMRRTGIVLGILGACAGGVLAYADASPLWHAWHEHRKFQAFLATPTVRRMAGNDWFAKHPPGAYRGCNAAAFDLPSYDTEHCRFNEWSSVDKGTLLWIEDKPVPGKTAPPLPEGYVFRDEKRFPLLQERLDSFAPDPNPDAISLIHYDLINTVTSIEVSTGEKIKRQYDLPSLQRTFVVSLVFPLVGFLLPWGAMRTIAWIAAGFMTAKGA